MIARVKNSRPILQIDQARPRYRWILCRAAVVIGVLGIAEGGCNSPAPYEFDALDLTPTQDELIEFSLGHYSIPIPVVRPYEQKEKPRQNRIEFDFDLYALIPRDYEREMTDSWARHEGKIRDRIIRVCRAASLEELQESELSTLKSHLTDAVQSQLGRTGIRRLLVAEVSQREL
jgi:hypothetical protein